jgi:serine phosphatase RsbU (regulator of sigma subunit)
VLDVIVKPRATLKPLDPGLRAEVLEWAAQLRVIWAATGLSLGQFAVLHPVDKGTISRYLNGERVPRDHWFLDKLLAILADKGDPVTPVVCEHLTALHLRALEAAHPHEYKVRLIQDELKIAVTSKLEAERYARTLEEQLAQRNLEIRSLAEDKGRLRSAWHAEHDRLQRAIRETTRQLRETEERATQAEQRCALFEDALDQINSPASAGEDHATFTSSATSPETSRWGAADDVDAELATRLQQSVIVTDARVDSRLAKDAGLDIAVRYRPAVTDRGAGDWYDVMPMPGGDLLLVVGDIAGHGVAAVTAMVGARRALRGLADTGASPAELLRQLNYGACHLTDSITGTVICGRYNPDRRELRWARAGHLPPVLVRDGAAATLALPEGMLLGADPAAEYAEVTLGLRPEDTLLLFTDGLIERRAASISDVLDDLAATALPGGPDVEAHASRIVAGTASDTGDDACLVVIRIM